LYFSGCKMVIFNSIKIISGGQTGVDRAALDFALEHGMACGGFCTKGRKAEDGILSCYYPLNETTSTQYPVRTRQNIKESDGTMILHLDKMDAGTFLTQRLCKELHKPLWIQNINFPINKKEFIYWKAHNKIRILNFAGPRESFSPGIYITAKTFMENLFF
jgi:hypothetical protein